MKMKELILKEAEELKATLSELRKKLDDFSFKIHQGQLKDVREVRETKKDVARILTALKRLDNSKEK